MRPCYTTQESSVQAGPSLWNTGVVIVEAKAYLPILFAFWSISALAQKENAVPVTSLSWPAAAD